MKFKVGDYAKPKDGRAEECVSFDDDNNGGYIKITGLYNDGDYAYDIYNHRGYYITWCNWCFNNSNLEPYTPTPAQLKAMGVKEGVKEPEEPKQTKPQLTYTKDIIYTRSDGTVFKEDGITYNDEFISVKTLRLHSNLYKAWRGRKFDD